MTIHLTIEIDPKTPQNFKLLKRTGEYLLALANDEFDENLCNKDAEEIKEVYFVDKNDLVNKFASASTAPRYADVTIELDTEFKPWDPELHSSTKAKNKDGRWKLKRNTDHKIESAPVILPPPEPTPVPPPEDLHAKFMGKVTEKVVSGKLTQNALVAFLRDNGIPDVFSIPNFPHLLPELIQKIEVLKS